MTYAKKIICLVLSMLFVLSMAACGNEEEYVPSWEKNQGENDSQDGGSNNDQSSESGENGGGEQSTALTFYDKYKNVVEIGDFHNGIASFQVASKMKNTDSLVYSFGYLDIEGTVIICKSSQRLQTL